MSKFKKGDYVQVFDPTHRGQTIGIGKIVSVLRRQYVDGKGYLVRFIDIDGEFHKYSVDEAWLEKSTKKEYFEYLRMMR